MQALAAYSFEANGIDSSRRVDQVALLVDDWLAGKGAVNPQLAEGEFVSKTGDKTGQFARAVIRSGSDVLHEVELIETAHTGDMFTTSLQFASSGDAVSVYASLGAAPGQSRVAPIAVYPRCPLIIRTLIANFSDWRFAGQEVPLSTVFDATTDDAARQLCDALRSKTRRLPIIVVSNDEDELVWRGLQNKLADELIGLADVAVVSAESSWVLTDELGPRDSCYLGAVRLYWPGGRADGSLLGINWRAGRLGAFGKDGKGRHRFLALMRREVMSVAALTMPSPTVFRRIRSEAEKERLRSLTDGARDRELDSIVEENSRLTARLEAAEGTIQTLRWKMAAGAMYAERKGDAADDGADVEQAEDGPEARPAPAAGETRYYKKIGSGGGVDALVITKACSHREANWRPAFKGDQAEKGLLKLEGRNDWKSIAHCSSCTGGGRWRVHW
ncbi:hypothetical protein DFR41_110157 [Pseudacidovorax intermedius]|uniref:Uncharacterized protein n=1 Tax=Pseudacidovorax intermedius TaxID=433924 RepID=A0A370FC15_9BURK|nr:hypothetical protein [Pseudacidovorax intermedius]RDI20749.1 hypothetical protein DFR41_110157 [Pseudacidovorax intermedius]